MGSIRACMRTGLAGVVLMLAAPAGTGLLYLLRDVRLLAFGPMVGDALPLQQLAGYSSQPLARVATAFMLVGLAAGSVLALLQRGRRPMIVGIASMLASGLLVASGAGADAVANSAPFWPRVWPQLSHPGLWASSGALALGVAAALLSPSLRKNNPRPTGRNGSPATVQP